MTDQLFVDVSEHQGRSFDDSYPYQFALFRAASEYGRIDYQARANLAWCLKARADGRLDNFGVYIVPCVVDNASIFATLDQLGTPDDCVVMLDIEGWWNPNTRSALVTGNHSGQINQLAEQCRSRQQGRADLVWGYGNMGDLGSLWPTRPAWLGLVEAGYGNPAPSQLANLIGWQYSNGAENGTSWPASTPPFGPCDHDVLYIPIPTPEGDDEMSAAEVQQILTAVKQSHDNLVDEIRQDRDNENAVVRQEVQTNRGQNNQILTAVGALRPAADVVTEKGGLSDRVAELQSAVADLAEKVATLETGGVDPGAVSKAAHDGAADGARAGLNGATLTPATEAK